MNTEERPMANDSENAAEKEWSREDLQQATTANEVLQAYVELSKVGRYDKAELMMLAGEALTRLGETIKAMQFIISAEQTKNFTNFADSTEKLGEIVSYLDRSFDGFSENIPAFRAAIAEMSAQIQSFSSATNRMEEVASTTNRAAHGMIAAAEEMKHASARISESADSINNASYRMGNR